MREDLGIERVLWLGEVCSTTIPTVMSTISPDRRRGSSRHPGTDHALDPNRLVYEDAAALRSVWDRGGTNSSPGRTERDGEIVPASYMNFYIGKRLGVVPIWGRPNAKAALDAISALFRDARLVGFEAHHLLTGGGSFHCISQQMPRERHSRESIRHSRESGNPVGPSRRALPLESGSPLSRG